MAKPKPAVAVVGTVEPVQAVSTPPSPTRYAQAGEIFIAYQTLGESGPDLIFLPNLFSNIELYWELPRMERWFKRIATFSRLIVFDQRGTGLSDPVSFERLVLLEERTEDIVAVLDAVGSERAIVFAATSACLLALYFAASNSDRCAGLVLLDGFARTSPEVAAKEEEIIGTIPEKWGTPEYRTQIEIRPDREFLARYRRHSLAPGGAAAMFRAAGRYDVTSLLPAIRVPTLLLSHPDVSEELVGEAALIAEGIEGSRHVELPGTSFSWANDDQDLVLDEVEDFVTGHRPIRGATETRVLSTLLFTDMVSSTEHNARVGDRAWSQIVDQHNEIVQAAIGRHGGIFIDSAGDGVLSRFDGPARAIRCAIELRDHLARIGIAIRAGLHTGEVELAGNGVRGLAVVIGARISTLGEGDEILASSTVKDLVVGSGIEFEAHGEHSLKGMPETWRVYRVVS